MSTSPVLLVLETCYESTRVVLIAGQKHYLRQAGQQRKQAQSVLVLIDELFTQANIDRQCLDGIAYFNGPGSFTGIRIGAAVVEGLSMGLNVPVYGLSSLKMLAYEAYAQGLGNKITAVINAHMQEVYCASFEFFNDELNLLSEPENISYDGFLAKVEKDSTLVGNGLLLPELSSLSGVADLKVKTDTLVKQVLSAFEQGGFTDFPAHEPVYLRNSIAWKKLSEQPKLLQD